MLSHFELNIELLIRKGYTVVSIVSKTRCFVISSRPDLI